MKTTPAIWLALVLAACGPLQAQVQQKYKTTAMWSRDTPKGAVVQYLLSGDKRTTLAPHDDLITPFQIVSLHDGHADEVQLVAQAPECHVDTASGRAWDKGPMVLFTPTNNVWVQGEGFYFVKSNQLLCLSNKIETRLLRSMLRTTMMGAPRTNAPDHTAQMLKIFADGPAFFNYQSNFAHYFGQVHVIDAQLDMTSERLFVQFTTNNTIRDIEAQDHVVMTTTNKGRATAARAVYWTTNGSEMTELDGDADWREGDERATADQFIYDSTRHFLRANGHVHVWLPATNAQPAANSMRELQADFATLQMPPTNGPVEAMHASGHVIIVNDADQSRATGDEADYARTNDLFQLTGSPAWSNAQMEIKGRTLTAESVSKTYHARGDAHFKARVAGSRSNQWLYIESKDMDYRTNLATFTDHVKARLVEDGALQDTLTCDKLDVELFTNEVKTAIARGHAQGEIAPDKQGRIQTLSCDELTAHRSLATKLMTDIVAETNVVLRQFGTNAERAQLSAARATAYFSAVTNRLEHAVAERDVVIDYVKTNQSIHATGEHAVFTVEADEVKLTGTPAARMDQYAISNCDCMIWQPKTNSFRAFGAYTIMPAKVTAHKPSS